MDGHYSDWLSVTSGGPQGSILGPLFFILFINDLPDVLTSSKIALYADDSKIYKVKKTQNDSADFQSDLNRICHSTVACWQGGPGGHGPPSEDFLGGAKTQRGRQN